MPEDTTYLDVTLDYREAHKHFLTMGHVIPEIRCAVCHAYASAVTAAPQLAKLKFYDDCQPLFEEALSFATGKELEAFYVWSWLVEEWWDRLVTGGGCPHYVGAWEICRIHTMRVRIMDKLMDSKPWRRSEKGKVKAPKNVYASSQYAPADYH